MYKNHMPLKFMVGMLSLIFIFTMLIPTALAQPQLSSSNFAIRVWPEYDPAPAGLPQEKPSVLAIITGVVDNNGTEPVKEITFSVPKGAVITYVQDAYKIDQKDDHQLLILTPASPVQPGAGYNAYFEYYYSPVTGETNKEFDFSYSFNFPVKGLMVEVKEPLRTTNFITDPAPVASSPNADGFQSTAHQFMFTDVPVEQGININVKYTKPDNQPSITDAPIPQPAPGQSQGQGQQTPNPDRDSFNGFVMGFTSLFLIGLGVVVVYGMTKTGEEGQEQTARGKKRKKPEKAGKPKAQAKQEKDDRINAERKKLRKLLADGHITEEGYKKMLEELEN